MIRGLPGVVPGIMEGSVRALTDWAFTRFDLSSLRLRVFADNESAGRLYRRCGFAEVDRTPMVRVVDGQTTSWFETTGSKLAVAERFFVTMELPQARWRRSREWAA